MGAGNASGKIGNDATAGLARLMPSASADDKSSMAHRDAEHAILREPVAAHAKTPRHESLFETRVTALSRLALAANLEGLVSVLRDAQPERLQRATIEAKYVNETSFFRDDQPFEVLRTQVLPRLVAGRRAERRLRIWSAACSTGQEAYSLALLLTHGFSELADWDVKIVGTDVSAAAISYARGGRYRPCETDRGLPGFLREQYFMRAGDGFQICEEIRKLCEFHVADLGEPLPQMPLFDLILLRNVLFYLPPGERGCVFKTAFRQLYPKGLLMLGDAEQAEDSTRLFEPGSGPESYFYRPVLRLAELVEA